jgi:cyanobactin maturation PatA/PatG family protease
MNAKVQDIISQNLTSLEKLQELGNHGAGIKIAIIDGAIDTNHTLLKHAKIEQSNQDVPQTTHHGTAVASQIVGRGLGAAPRAEIISLPVFSEDNGQLVGCSDLKLAKALSTAAEVDCDLVNVSGSSLSSLGNGTQEMREAVKACDENNALVVAAIGNDGAGCEAIPASIDRVLAVGAHDDQGTPADFNNYGPKLRKKAILAPGVTVAAALCGDKLANISGTSFAAPLVTGIAALVMRAIQTATGEFNARDVYDLLSASVTPRSTSCGGDDDRTMAGRLDIDAVLHALLAQYPTLAAQITPQTQRSHAMKNSGESPQVMPASVELDAAVQPQSQDITPAAADADAVDVAPAAQGEMRSESSSITPADLNLPTIAEAGAHMNVHAQPKAAPAPAAPHAPEIRPQVMKGSVSALTADKTFVIGQIGYDFGTEARLDYFTQQMGGRGSHPYDPLELSSHLFEEQNVDQSSALTWTLKIDGIPVYAIEPENQFAAYEYGRLVSFLYDQEKQGVERAAIAGTITGETRLFNGQIVPTISPVLRGMYNWKSEDLAKAVVESADGAADADADTGDNGDTPTASKETAIEGFLNRVYYELRNRGRTSPERAMNYAATNAYQMSEVFEDALAENLFLNEITAKESPVSRPDSDCWDVIMEFFNPKERLTASRKLYRYTIDVSDIMPVTVGDLRSWHAY